MGDLDPNQCCLSFPSSLFPAMATPVRISQLIHPCFPSRRDSQLPLIEKQQIQPKKRLGFEGDTGDAFSRSLWRRSPSRSCSWLGTRTGHRAGKQQERGRSRCQAHASLECGWECREGWHGSSWRRPEQTPAHGPASPGCSRATFPTPLPHS